MFVLDRHIGKIFFFLYFQEGTALDFYLSTFKGRNQPFVLVIGGSYKNPGQCFVVLERKAYERRSLLAAIDFCYKVIQILDLEYPTQVSNVWNFFDTIVYAVTGVKQTAAVQQFGSYHYFTSSPQQPSL